MEKHGKTYSSEYLGLRTELEENRLCRKIEFFLFLLSVYRMYFDQAMLEMGFLNYLDFQEIIR